MAEAAFNALANLANISKRAAKGLPEKLDASPRWSGVGFSSLGFRFVAPMGQIVELMEVPSTTLLPGVKPWVMGLSNVRGRLLPIFDFAMFLGGVTSQFKRNHRVLVLETDTLYSGLLVDQAFGMQHFDTNTFIEGLAADVSDSVKPYVAGHYVHGATGDTWNVFDFYQLAQNPRFANAGIV